MKRNRLKTLVERGVSNQPGFSFAAEPEGADARTGIIEYGVGVKYQ